MGWKNRGILNFWDEKLWLKNYGILELRWTNCGMKNCAMKELWDKKL